MNLRKLFTNTEQSKQNIVAPSKEFFDSTVPMPMFEKSLTKNKKHLQNAFSESMDFHMEDLKIGGRDGAVCYLSTLLDKKQLSKKVLEPIQYMHEDGATVFDEESLENARQQFFPGQTYEYGTELGSIIKKILNGYAVILIDGLDQALTLEIGDAPTRAISEPSTQTIIRGPKDGFIEDLPTNMSLIRRRIRNPNLMFEMFEIGTDTHSNVVIAYLRNIVNEELLSEIRKRLKETNVSQLLDSGALEELITDEYRTPFPLVYNSERPDTAAAHIISGKIVILVAGSPFVLSVPTVFTDFFQVSEDYFQPFIMGSFIRLIRYISFFVSLLFPSLYVAVTTFHHELLPTDLLISIQAQRSGVPFPAVFEILLMELTFEILREAGIRMPRAVGQTVSIVGALVIGQAAVEAGIVSNVLVIIVALTAISNFVSPIYNFSVATRLLRFLFIFLGSVTGLYGVLLGLIVMVIHLVKLRSFGIPYLEPVAPLRVEDQDDVFIRLPPWINKKRPTYLQTKAPLKTENMKRSNDNSEGENSS